MYRVRQQRQFVCGALLHFKVLEIDLALGMARSIGVELRGTAKYGCAMEAANGKIYAPLLKAMTMGGLRDRRGDFKYATIFFNAVFSYALFAPPARRF